MKKLNKNGRDLVRTIVLLIVILTWVVIVNFGFLFQILGFFGGISTIIWYISKSEVVVPRFLDSLEVDDYE